MSCNKKIIKLYLPSGVITNGSSRATSINLKLAGNGCCKQSNIVSVTIPPALPPTPPGPPPDVCLGLGTNLLGHIVKVIYDPKILGNVHGCNATIFDFYINNIFIGLVNLNNAGDYGYRESVFSIKENIIANPGFNLELRCALNLCHQGVAIVQIWKPDLSAIVFNAKLPNDKTIIDSQILCP